MLLCSGAIKKGARIAADIGRRACRSRGRSEEATTADSRYV